MKKGTKLFWDVLLAGVGAAIETAQGGIESLAEEQQAKIMAPKASEEEDEESLVSGENA